MLKKLVPVLVQSRASQTGDIVKGSRVARVEKYEQAVVVDDNCVVHTIHRLPTVIPQFFEFLPTLRARSWYLNEGSIDQAETTQKTRKPFAKFDAFSSIWPS